MQSNIASSDDRALMVRVRNGDVQAFERLFRLFHERLLVFANTYIDDRDIAADLVSDVFFSLWSAREKLEIKESVQSYLFTATRNRALNYIRSHRRESARYEALRDADDTSQEPYDLGLGEAHTDHLLWDAVSQLPDRAKAVITLRWKEQMKLVDIAQTMGVSPGAVEKIHKRALDALAKKLPSLLR